MPDEPTPITLVVFRRWRDVGSIFALFPEQPSDIDGVYCDAYESLGGHGGANYFGCIQAPVTPNEARSLAAELTRIGYFLKPIMRASCQVHDRRRATARAFCN